LRLKVKIYADEIPLEVSFKQFTVIFLSFSHLKILLFQEKNQNYIFLTSKQNIRWIF